MLQIRDFDYRVASTENWPLRYVNVVIEAHIDVEAGLSLMKSTIAESGTGVTSRPYRTKHIEF